MKLLLGICGSIAAYKCYDMVRHWVKEGHEVQVILTKGGERFVLPDLFVSLGAKKVWKSDDDFLTPDEASFIPHIALAKWCDRLIVAPLSANTLSKCALGLCDDLLTTLFLAIDQKPVLFYPAMNTHMLNHPHIQGHLHKLQQLPHVFVHPTTEGALACGDFGQGKLPDVALICETAQTFPVKLRRHSYHVIITTGATIAPIDPVRYVTNPSSGITGYSLARAFLASGLSVTLIAGKNSVKEIDYLKSCPFMEIVRVTTALEMEREVLKRWGKAQFYVGAAAICDFQFDYEKKKIKREDLAGKLEYHAAPDVLQSVLKEQKKNAQWVVGFAAETDTSPETFKKKWLKKKVDLLVGNRVSGGFGQEVREGFGTASGSYFMVEQGDIREDISLSKNDLAHYLLSWMDKQFYS